MPSLLPIRRGAACGFFTQRRSWLRCPRRISRLSRLALESSNQTGKSCHSFPDSGLVNARTVCALEQSIAGRGCNSGPTRSCTPKEAPGG